MQLLIRASLTHQEQRRVAAGTSGAGKRVLIIGGAGKMGAWFAHFLSSQGFAIEIADPSPAAVAFPRVADWRDNALDHDLIVVATPMKVAGDVLTELAARRPRGVVVDIGSLKSPLRGGLERLVAAGCKVTSIHPMFGPDTRLLSGRHVVFCDVGVPEATRAARALFASTMAEQIEMSVDDHDRLMAYVLGLSHALNLAFFTALAASGELVPRLQRMSSTTFDAQLKVATLGRARQSASVFRHSDVERLRDGFAAGTARRDRTHRAARAEPRRGGVRRADGGGPTLSREPDVSGATRRHEWTGTTTSVRSRSSAAAWRR